MSDGSLLFDTKLDTSGISSGLGKIGSLAGTGLKAAAAGVAAVTAAGVAAGTAFVNAANATASYGDNVDKMSQKLGISAEAYQKWDFVLQQNGASIEGLQTSMKTLATQAQNNAEEFKALGITEEEVANLSQEELFERTIAGLQGMEEGTERTAIAAKLLGKSATELGPLLNQTAEDTEALKKQAEDYGLVMSDDAIKASAAFCDSMNLMQQTMAGMKNRAMAEFLPAITKVTDGLALLFTGDTSGVDSINEGINEILGKVDEIMPKVLEVGGSIISNLAGVLLENLPTIIDTGMDILFKLVDGIIQALPQLLEAAMQICERLASGILEYLPQLIEVALQMILTLAQGIAQSIPQLIPQIIEIVLQICTTLIDNLPLLIESAIQIFLGIITGLIQALPQIIAALPTLIDSIINALINSIPLLVDCGVQLFVALIQNLPAIIVAIVKAVPEIVNSIIKGFTALFGSMKTVGSDLITKVKEGLLSMASNIVAEAKNIGGNIVDGIKNGISAGWEKLKSWVGDLASSLFDSAKSALGIESPSKKFRYLGEMCVAGFDDGIEGLMDGDAIGASINASLGTISANVGAGLAGGAGASQTFNFYDTQTSPDAIRRKVQNTMTFGLAGGI